MGGQNIAFEQHPLVVEAVEERLRSQPNARLLVLQTRATWGTGPLPVAMKLGHVRGQGVGEYPHRYAIPLENRRGVFAKQFPYGAERYAEAVSTSIGSFGPEKIGQDFPRHCPAGPVSKVGEKRGRLAVRQAATGSPPMVTDSVPNIRTMQEGASMGSRL